MTGSDHFGAASCCARNFVYDGTRNVGWNEDGQCDVSGWKNIRLPKAAGNADNDVIEAGTL